MIWTQNVLFVLLLLLFSSNVGLAQTDMTGRWEVRLQIFPEFGSGTYDSIWEVEQSGKKVSGSITEVSSGKATKFKDGYRGKSGSLDFTIKSQFQGTPATIEVGVKVKNGNFEGLYDIVIADALNGNDDGVDTIVMSGKLTGRKVADAASSVKGNKKAGKKKIAETEVLFDGKNLDKFRGYKKESIGKGWKVNEGLLHFDGAKSGGIITKEQYGSFELTFDWKISEGGDSGVLYRVTLGDAKPYRSGIEYQILDNLKHKDGKKPKKIAGSLYALYQPDNAVPKAVGEWNSSKIVADGDKVEHWLNGEKVVAIEIDSDEWKEKVEASKFAKWKKFGKSKRGHIAFQDHGDPVWFRNIKIKAMD